MGVLGCIYKVGVVGCGGVWWGVVGCGQVWFLNAPDLMPLKDINNITIHITYL